MRGEVDVGHGVQHGHPRHDELSRERVACVDALAQHRDERRQIERLALRHYVLATKRIPTYRFISTRRSQWRPVMIVYLLVALQQTRYCWKFRVILRAIGYMTYNVGNKVSRCNRCNVLPLEDPRRQVKQDVQIFKTISLNITKQTL